MTVDPGQFVNTFLEESFEGLDLMESELLGLDSKDEDAIHSIFRAAHTIKGGAGTFGFKAVGDFTHGVETLLDQLRDGRRSMDGDLSRLLLEAVDCIRDMLEATRDGGEADNERIVRTAARIEQLLQVEQAPEAQHPSPVSSGSDSWHIGFKPDQNIMMTGNDPLRLLQVLSGLGQLRTECHLGNLPSLEELDPHLCHLSWDLYLQGQAQREQIEEIFEWVEDECELHIEPLSTAEPETLSSANGPDASIAEASDALAGNTERPRPAGRSQESSSIRVNTDKVDALINMVGELVITQSMLSQIGEDLQGEGHYGHVTEKLQEGLAQLERHTRELQENVMSIRMLPISVAFNRLPRMVHDLSDRLEKKVELKLSGEQTELDKTVLEKIGDPLMHLVRNGLDHGIESPEARRKAGKNETGTLHLHAQHKGGNILIEISDDGAGLNRERILAKAVERGLVTESQALSDEQIDDLIFDPGFSTADTVSDVSGRGVGMDVVRKNIHALGGSVDVTSTPGIGSRFIIRLPLTLAILDGLLVDVAGQTYVIPLLSIIESLQVDPERLQTIANRNHLYRLRDEYIPVLQVQQLMSTDGAPPSRHPEQRLLVVVESEGRKSALLVDDLLGQQQVVIKALESNYARVPGLSGATILGDGMVALILDISGLNAMARQPSHIPPHAAA